MHGWDMRGAGWLDLAAPRDLGDLPSDLARPAWPNLPRLVRSGWPGRPGRLGLVALVAPGSCGWLDLGTNESPTA